ncbi:DUF2062 domain-containing protein [Aquabacterium sp. A08]|uniref:DUF2062 domain-containing protein n=1 Tax=Aquabacterium sp. A08 TaxID=2718532 RepID=UPI001421588E|nr:DUF2062 domain-containing protein [Aquabacterium sp. A08]NIC43133.1 DUF2062 domain-containing protein [Aquabacterium sp. A08]
MKHRLKRLLPTRDSLLQHRWLGWLGPRLQHPRLWHMSRKGIALGLALGMFFGLLIPVAQIPFSATLAVLLRANLPVAVASTLVTNPVTFGPVYYGAYKLGKLVLLEDHPSQEELQGLLEQHAAHQAQEAEAGFWAGLQHALGQLGQVGKPLVVGLAIVASCTGVAVYFLVNLLWTLKVRWSRRRRLQRRPGAR